MNLLTVNSNFFPFLFITLCIIITSLFDLPCHRNSMKLMQISKILVNLSHTYHVEYYFPKHKLSVAELIFRYLYPKFEL